MHNACTNRMLTKRLRFDVAAGEVSEPERANGAEALARQVERLGFTCSIAGPVPVQNCQYRNSLLPVSRIIDTAAMAAKSTIQATVGRQ